MIINGIFLKKQANLIMNIIDYISNKIENKLFFYHIKNKLITNIMTITLLLFQSPTLEESEYEEFFKPLDENNKLVQETMCAIIKCTTKKINKI